MTRSIFDLMNANYVISTSEQLGLAQNRYAFYFDDGGKFIADDVLRRSAFWKLDVTDSSYDDASGKMRVLMDRKNPGYMNLKVGGACYIGLRFQDSDGVQVDGGYFKWADENDGSGTAALSMVSAVALAAVTLMF